MPVVAKQSNKSVPPKVTKAVQTAKEAFLSGVVPIEQLPDIGIKMLITGPNASGKTTLACDAPKPLLLVRPEAVEDGSISVKTVKGIQATPKLTEDIQLEYLIDEQREKRLYKTIVLDGVQFYQDLIMKRVLSLQEVPAQLNWGVASMKEWGIVTNEFKVRMRRLFSLSDPPYLTNIIVTGGERIINDSEGSVIPPSIVVALNPSAAGWINFVADYIVCTLTRDKEVTETLTVGSGQNAKHIPMVKKVGGIEYCARLIRNDLYTAKYRVPKGTVLPEIMPDPTWDKLYRIIKTGG